MHTIKRRSHISLNTVILKTDPCLILRRVLRMKCPYVYLHNSNGFVRFEVVFKKITNLTGVFLFCWV